MVMQKEYFGIDFGTTNTSIVKIVVAADGSQQEYFLGDYDNKPFVSLMAINKVSGKTIFGREVKKYRRTLSQEYKIIASFKTILGTNKKIRVAGKNYTAIEIVGLFFNYIKEVLQTKNITVQEAFFSCPINFSANARNALVTAAQMAGIKILGLACESTAAYVANSEKIRAVEKVMVIDWGGGTLDLSILNIKDNNIYEEAVFGLRCGGDDIDVLFARNVHNSLIHKYGKKIYFSKMLRRDRDHMVEICEQAKIKLGTDSAVGISLVKYGEFGDVNIDIDKEYFSTVIAPLLEKVVYALQETLKKSMSKKEELGAIILVGDTAKIPVFQKLIRSVFAVDKIVMADKMEWSVAYGAALINLSNSEEFISEDVGILLANNEFYPVLKKDVAKVGTITEPIDLVVNNNQPSTSFIFTNPQKRINYGLQKIATTGLLREVFTVQTEIAFDQIAYVKITNSANDSVCNMAINKLKFHYKL